MTYEIIKDLQALEEFIKWLPELTIDELYYVSLFARKKYHPSANNDKSQCKRFTATSKEWLLKKMKQLEIKENGYFNKNGTPIHEDSLAVYINLNPRSIRRAQKQLLIKLADTVTTDNNYQNPSMLALSAIQKSRSRVVFVDFDFDTDKEFSFYKDMIDKIVDEDAYSVIITRGGFHLLVDPIKATLSNRMWYKSISNLPDCDIVGDNLVPVPGCTQGGFTPILI